MRDVLIQKLTSENFSPFGDVIEPSSAQKAFAINEGNTHRYHDCADINTLANKGKTVVSIFRSTPIPFPLFIQTMERHPLSSQAFIPLSDQPYLVIVAPQGEFDESDISIFVASPNQGVNYHAGTWHHYSLALNQVCDFLVIDREGEGNNCDEEPLKKPFYLQADEVYALC